MNAFFNLHRHGLEWVSQFLPGANPYLLPFCNKPLLEFWLDFCSMAHVKKVLIADPEYDRRIEEIVGDGTKWDMEIVYLGESTTSDAREALLHHERFFDDNTPILVFNGFFFLQYHQQSIPEENELLVSDGKPAPAELSGLFCARNGEMYPVPLYCARIDSIQSYFDHNLFLLDDESDNYVLPGYKIENGIFTGMNDVIPPTAKISAPAMFGDNVSLSTDCALEGNVILGNNVIIDKASTLKDTLVLPNTYIGTDLEFSHVIVYQSYVVDPSIPVSVNLTDAQLTGKLRAYTGLHLLTTSTGWLLALLTFLLMLPLYTILRLCGVRPVRIRTIWFRNEPPLRHDYYLCDGTLRSRLFFMFSLDRVPLLAQVLTKRIHLVGDYRYDPEEPGMHEFLHDNYPDYQPGVFCLTESAAIGKEEEAQRLIDDLYYRHNRSFYFDFLIFLRCLLRRILGTGYVEK